MRAVRLFGPLLPALVIAGCVMFGFKPGWSIEPPPPQYASGPTQTGKTTETPNLTPEQVAWLCSLYGTESSHQAKGSLLACYAPRIDQVILPAAKYWPSSDELDQLRSHEYAHARGWRHNDDGTGTGPNSLAPVAPNPAAVTLGNTLAPPAAPIDPRAAKLAAALRGR